MRSLIAPLLYLWSVCVAMVAGVLVHSFAVYFMPWAGVTIVYIGYLVWSVLSENRTIWASRSSPSSLDDLQREHATLDTLLIESGVPWTPLEPGDSPGTSEVVTPHAEKDDDRRKSAVSLESVLVESLLDQIDDLKKTIATSKSAWDERMDLGPTEYALKSWVNDTRVGARTVLTRSLARINATRRRVIVLSLSILDDGDRYGSLPLVPVNENTETPKVSKVSYDGLTHDQMTWIGQWDSTRWYGRGCVVSYWTQNTGIHCYVCTKPNGDTNPTNWFCWTRLNREDFPS